MKKRFQAAMVLLLFLPLYCSLALPASSADIVYSWRSNGKKIALTFDDGPHPVHTPEILDILEEYGVKATFFTIGQNVEWYNDVFQMEYAAGHEIGNHTYSHRNLKKLSYPAVCQEIERAENAVYETVEYRTRLLRPPEGAFGNDLCKAAAALDYTVVCWSIDTRDWAHTPSDKIAENVLSSVKGGDIILFHDFVSGDSPTPDALRMIIPPLMEEGYRFVTVSELLNLK
ncbi:MAG: polysaccharide deacetylase family protein [Eubacteriales bacterium]